MSDTVIQVDNLSKRYRLGLIGTGTLSHDLNRWWARVRGKPDPYLKIGQDRTADDSEYMWALRDVSFEVKRGEALGIIGCNGAGKSTLLKILSRVTAPTSGEVLVKGRIASLLEVGTGFHHELTGRENIFLNGAILGMGKEEIRRKFDEIVAFAEIDKFIDTPVKRYSSGMYVRLAFGVAAHLEPEILIVDEVLAVGDAAFQKKCLGKMQDVGKAGRTVLFVSHNMSAIRQLCTSCLWLSGGAKKESGLPAHIIESYLREVDRSNGKAEIFFEQDSKKEFQVIHGRLVNKRGETASVFTCDEEVIVELACVVNQKIPGLYGYMTLMRTDGVTVIESDSYDIMPNRLDDLHVGKHLLSIVLPPRTVGVGDYLVYLNFTSTSGMKGFNIDSPGHILSLSLEDPNTRRGNNRNGFLSTRLHWNVRSL